MVRGIIHPLNPLSLLCVLCASWCSFCQILFGFLDACLLLCLGLGRVVLLPIRDSFEDGKYCVHATVRSTLPLISGL